MNNRTFKACAASDPSVRRPSTSQQYLQVLAKARPADNADEEQCTREVAKNTTSPRTATAAPGTPVDAFWAQTDMREYPLLTGVARKLLGAFHGHEYGLAVETSFSNMGEILNSGSKQDRHWYLCSHPDR